jgi:hypothetical protein
MPKIAYIEQRFAAKSKKIIDQANIIIAEYQRQGFTLTLRQLYYQFVARDYLVNTAASYNKLGSIINDARLAGLIDWNSIEDRTRNLRSLAHWNDPAEIVAACASQFRVDLWATQPARVEVWIEKDALIGVIEQACEELDVPYFSCRGYVSQSEMWGAAQRAVKRMQRTTAHRYLSEVGVMNPQRTIVLHFGDHDPSGIDMTRDITDRINMFCAKHGHPNAFEMRRLALNMTQVEQYNPPPNFAKVTDSRFIGYQEVHGDESWELDALEPAVLDALIRDELDAIIDPDEFNKLKAVQVKHREELTGVSNRWQDVVNAIDEDRL